MDWGSIIMSVIGALTTGGVFSSIFFFKENKKKKQLDNDSTASSQWQELYERAEAKSESQSKKIEELFKANNDLRDQNNNLTTENAVLKIIKCKRISCEDRDPPLSRKVDCLFPKIAEQHSNMDHNAETDK